jgi:hypothetical protein
MKILRNILFFSIAISLIFVVSALTINAFSERVEKLEDCTAYPYEVTEPLYSNCTEQRVVQLCEDEPLNTSCVNQSVDYVYLCAGGSKTSVKYRTECETKGVVVDEALQIDTENYACNTEDDGDKVIVICDSKYDGNGDGICQSGESCLKYVVDGKKYQRFEKNSREDYVEKDKSFFVEHANVEVLQ